MNHLLETFTGFPSSSQAIAIVFKITLLLVAAQCAVAILRRQSAAARHLVWALALAGVLAMPLVTAVAPEHALPLPFASRLLQATRASESGGSTTPRTGLPARAIQPRRDRDHAPSTAVAGAAAETNRAGGWRFGIPSLPWGWLALLWICGCVGVLAKAALGHLGLARLARRAVPLAEDAWRELLHETQGRARVSNGIRLCRSAAVGSPVTWGWTDSIIALPAGADDWPLERRRAALAHELAHVARHDYIIQLGATFACALYWFHPLVWFAARQLRAASEHACDDRVLASGTSAPDYARHLLDVARGARLSRLTGSVVVCMARPSHLEGRLLAVLDDARSRRVPGRRARLAAAVVLGTVLVPFAGLIPAPQTAKAETDAGSDRVARAPGRSDKDISADADSTFEKTVAASPGERLSLDLETGGEVDVRGWDEDRVAVRVGLRGTDWRDTRVDVEREDGGVRIVTHQQRRRRSSTTSHAFEIRVPRRYDLQLESAGGSLTLVDLEGTLRGQTGGGDIVLEHFHGRVRLSTGGGDIRVEDVEASGTVSTGGGTVRLSRVQGGLRGTSGSGPVIYGEDSNQSGSDDPAEASYGDLDGVHVEDAHVQVDEGRVDRLGVLHIDKAGGDVVLESAPRGAKITTGGGQIRVGRAAGTVEANTGGGDIEIGPVAGSVVAGTGAGKVHVTVVDARGEAQSVTISSGTGAVVVDLPENLDAKFQVESAYTEGHRGTRIESDWKLEREIATEWDDRHGTPRKYVRARGVIGDGRGFVRIRTVNGDIQLRRGGGKR